jgi:hypothetical protein
LLQGARLAIQRNKPDQALRNLLRHREKFRHPRFADLRDDLWREALALSQARADAPETPQR